MVPIKLLSIWHILIIRALIHRYFLVQCRYRSNRTVRDRSLPTRPGEPSSTQVGRDPQRGRETGEIRRLGPIVGEDSGRVGKGGRAVGPGREQDASDFDYRRYNKDILMIWQKYCFDMEMTPASRLPLRRAARPQLPKMSVRVDPCGEFCHREGQGSGSIGEFISGVPRGKPAWSRKPAHETMR